MDSEPRKFEEMTSETVNTIGLVLDIAGVILLFFFGLPPELNRGGKNYLLLEQPNEDEARKAKGYEIVSWFALVLLIAGFGLQIWSNYL